LRRSQQATVTRCCILSAICVNMDRRAQSADWILARTIAAFSTSPIWFGYETRHTAQHPPRHDSHRLGLWGRENDPPLYTRSSQYRHERGGWCISFDDGADGNPLTSNPCPSSHHLLLDPPILVLVLSSYGRRRLLAHGESFRRVEGRSWRSFVSHRARRNGVVFKGRWPGSSGACCRELAGESIDGTRV
jgi:hypothetical protein